uniref:glutamine--fructose-6-phosphate transaminase (isomerizing) n=1 Tax=Globodera pallida TaxID=36090 RepID=A0A183C332_GLOPA
MRGLHQMEYRFYDSAGIAIDGNAPNSDVPVAVYRKKGDLHVLLEHINAEEVYGDAIRNNFVIVQNGISNFNEIKNDLENMGCSPFESETDTQLVARLTQILYEQNKQWSLLQIVQNVVQRLEGQFALAVKSGHFPNQLVATQRGCYLSAQSARPCDAAFEIEYFVASDASSVIEHTRRIIVLEDGDMAFIKDGTLLIDYSSRRSTVSARKNRFDALYFGPAGISNVEDAKSRQEAIHWAKLMTYRGGNSLVIAIDNGNAPKMGITVYRSTDGGNVDDVLMKYTRDHANMDCTFNNHCGVGQRGMMDEPPGTIVNIVRGFVFLTDGNFTNEQAIATLAEQVYEQNTNWSLLQIVEAVLQHQERQPFVLAVKSSHFPGQLVATRRGMPLLVGIKTNAKVCPITPYDSGTPGTSSSTRQSDAANSDVEYFVASDESSLIEHTRQILFLEDDDIVFIKDGTLTISNGGTESTRKFQTFSMGTIKKHRFLARYLGIVEVSNAQAEARQSAIHSAKPRENQEEDVPVVLEASGFGMYIRERNGQFYHDAVHLNFFAYLFREGGQYFCHVFYVGTPEMAWNITLSLNSTISAVYRLRSLPGRRTKHAPKKL